MKQIVIYRRVILSILVTFALSLSLNIIKFKDIGVNISDNWILKVITFFNYSFKKDIFRILIIFGFTYFLLEKTYRENKILSILSLLFSSFTVIGYSYYTTESWLMIFNNKLQFLKAIIVICGYFIIFKLILSYIWEYIIPKLKNTMSDNKALKYIFEEHNFIIPLIIFLVCWLPYVIIYYPGILTYDAHYQIEQYYGMDIYDGSCTNSVKLIDENVKITNHHPVLHTFILSNCVKLGGFFNNYNLGIFIYTLMQVVLLACTLAYIIKFMNRINANKWLRIGTLIFFAIFPVFPFNAIQITKDVPYVCMYIIYLCRIYDLLRKGDKEKIYIKNIISLIVLSLLICLFRNNGIYTIVFSLPFTAIICKSNRKKLLGITLIVFVIYEMFVKIFLPEVFKIPNSGIREMLSVPFQQTARYIRDYENEVTDKEKEKINKVLEYDVLSKEYTPMNSDPIKGRYNKEATSDDLKEYFKVWLKQFLKHPNVYVEAFLNNYYGYFYLQAEIEQYIIGDGVNVINGEEQFFEKFNYSYIDQFIEARKFANQLLIFNKKAPLISLTTNIALNNWMILGMIVYLIYNKKNKYVIFLLPSITTILICFLSPVNTYFRYAMPNIFAMPLIIGVFLDIINNKEEVINEEKNRNINTLLQ